MVGWEDKHPFGSLLISIGIGIAASAFCVAILADWEPAKVLLGLGLLIATAYKGFHSGLYWDKPQIRESTLPLLRSFFGVLCLITLIFLVKAFCTHTWKYSFPFIWACGFLFVVAFIPYLLGRFYAHRRARINEHE